MRTYEPCGSASSPQNTTRIARCVVTRSQVAFSCGVCVYSIFIFDGAESVIYFIVFLICRCLQFQAPKNPVRWTSLRSLTRISRRPQLRKKSNVHNFGAEAHTTSCHPFLLYVDALAVAGRSCLQPVSGLAAWVLPCCQKTFYSAL